jgi:hypothetical protein
MNSRKASGGIGMHRHAAPVFREGMPPCGWRQVSHHAIAVIVLPDNKNLEEET